LWLDTSKTERSINKRHITTLLPPEQHHSGEWEGNVHDADLFTSSDYCKSTTIGLLATTAICRSFSNFAITSSAGQSDKKALLKTQNSSALLTTLRVVRSALLFCVFKNSIETLYPTSQFQHVEWLLVMVLLWQLRWWSPVPQDSAVGVGLASQLYPPLGWVYLSSSVTSTETTSIIEIFLLFFKEKQIGEWWWCERLRMPG